MMKLLHEVARRWPIGTIAGCVCVLAVAGVPLVADESGPFAPEIPDAPAASDANDKSSDLDGCIEVTVNGGIRSRTRTDHSTSVTVKNISDEDLAGPLALVVDEAGLDELKVVKSDGSLSTGEPYLQLLAEDATLRAGASLRPKKVEFESDAAIPLVARRAFAPGFRVVRLTDEDRKEQLAENDADANLPGKSYSQAEMDRVMQIQEGATFKLMQMAPGDVFGTATAEDDQGHLVVRVFTSRPGIIRQLPGEVDGIPLQQQVTGDWFRAAPTTSRVIYPDGKPFIPNGQPVPDNRPIREVDGVSGADLIPSVDQTPTNEPSSPDEAAPGDEPVPGVDPAPGDEPGSGDEPTPGEEPVPGDEPTPDEPDSGSLFPDLNSPIQTELENPEFAGPGGDPTITFPRPVPIGVSSFNLDMFLCAAGTLGCRLVDGNGGQFALSNNHVWGGYLAIISNPRFPAGIGVAVVANPGDVAVQTSPGDLNPCAFLPQDQIGIVADYEPILLDTLQNCSMGIAPPNFMDATIIQADPGAIHYCTPDDGYGSPQRDVATAMIGMQVQKYGRTTVYTAATVTSVNGSTCIAYGPNLYGYFIKQIEIENKVPFSFPFSQGGDSGSLIVVKDPGGPNDRRPVALLFAGGPENNGLDLTIANPIGPVVTQFNMQVDDGSGAPATSTISGTSGAVVGPLNPPPPTP